MTIKPTRPASRLDASIINQVVDLLRHWGSPSCNLKSDLVETETEISDISALHPREYKRGREIYNNLYAPRKERNHK